MANYDITMKQYNGSDYDSLYPKDIGQQVLLNDSALRTLLGIAATNPTLNDAIAQLNTNAYNAIETGNYVGTGQSGSSHKNSLTFSFAPRFVCILGAHTNLSSSDIANAGLLLPGAGVGVCGEGNSALLLVSQNNKTVTWYNASYNPTPYVQLNDSDYTYYYIAFK